MKRHLIALSAVLGILMSLVAIASNAAETAPAPEVVPTTAAMDDTSKTATLPGTNRNGVLMAKSLTADELALLQNKEEQAPELLKQVAAGCRTVWDNDTQQNKTICSAIDPAVSMGLAGGIAGVVFGSFGGAAGAVVGGVVGFGIFYLAYKD